MKIGDTVKKIRKESGMSQVDFAEAVGCLQGSVSKWETYQKTPSLKMAQKIIKLAKKHKIKIKLEDFFPED